VSPLKSSFCDVAFHRSVANLGLGLAVITHLILVADHFEILRVAFANVAAQVLDLFARDATAVLPLSGASSSSKDPTD
jgi:hypothetical protein